MNHQTDFLKETEDTELPQRHHLELVWERSPRRWPRILPPSSVPTVGTLLLDDGGHLLLDTGGVLKIQG